MKFWNKLFLNGVKKFHYGSISLEWPNGITNKIDADKHGPHAHLKIADNNVIKEIIHGALGGGHYAQSSIKRICYNL